MRPRLLLVALAAVLPAFAPVPFPRANRKVVDDPTLLAGTWKVVRYERDGADWMPRGVATLWKVGKGRIQNFRVLPGGVEQPANTYDLRLDPKKSPRAIDLVVGGAVLWRGSYHVDRSRWQMTLRNFGEGERPTQFTSTGAFLIVLERQGR